MKERQRKHIRKNRLLMPLVLIVNLIIVISLVGVIFEYKNDYEDKLHEQNLNDIFNINTSTANIISAFFNTQQGKLQDIKQYVNARQMTIDELLDYIYTANSDKECHYEIVGRDFEGYYIDKNKEDEYFTVEYSNYGYSNLQELLKEDEDRSFVTPEFTDYHSAFKSFASYTHVRVWEKSGSTTVYTLMLVSKVQDFQEYIDLDGGFDGFSTVIADKNGNYILGNSAFKATNIYQYLYTYNDWSLDKRKEVEKEVKENGKGSLYYKNSIGKDCVYVYAQIPDTEWSSVSCVPIESFHSNNTDGKYVFRIGSLLLLIMAIDFTWLILMNKKSIKNERAAVLANNAKTDFLSRMSHDIRTPLNVINGMTILALQEENKETMNEYLQNINSSGKFLIGLVNDILDLNKVESGKMELHMSTYQYREFERYLNAVIAPLCKEKNIDFIVEMNKPYISMVTDKLRFNQIFFNLLSNAVKFTPEGGTISLICDAQTQEGGMATLNIKVSDTGIGMSSEFQKHMFEAFSQEDTKLSANVSGTGLGLAIVKNIVDLMNGDLEVISIPNEGTTFKIKLRVKLTQSVSRREDTSWQDVSLAGRRVLLCEDHPLNQQIAVKILQKKEIIADIAENGKIGLEMFEKSANGYYDAVLMDIQMPIMNGTDAACAIRNLDRDDARNIPIIAMTANAYDVDVKKSLESGMNAHLAKPFDPANLYQTLARLIQ